MKRRILLAAAAAFACLLATAGAAHGQRKGAPRLRFARGDSSATVEGAITRRRRTPAYVVGARAGQQMYLTAIARTSCSDEDWALIVLVIGADKVYQDIGASHARTTLGRNGDYRIELHTTTPLDKLIDGGCATRFRLSVKIE